MKTYDKLYEEGMNYQDFVTVELYNRGIIILNFVGRDRQLSTGENMLGMEIKYDQQASTTKNIYIEVAEKGKKENTSYVRSGIYRDDNSWLYFVGNYKTGCIFTKKRLRWIHKNRLYSKAVTTDTSKGFLLSTKQVKEYADKIITFGPKPVTLCIV